MRFNTHRTECCFSGCSQGLVEGWCGSQAEIRVLVPCMDCFEAGIASYALHEYTFQGMIRCRHRKERGWNC